MASISRGYASTRFGQIHYRSSGERRAGAPPLVLLHQTPSSSVMFERLMAELAGELWLLAPDVPGFGGTDALPEPPSVPLYAQVVAAFLERLDIARCALFGHHAGASVAAELARRAPALVARLVLSGPPLLSRAQLERRIPPVAPAKLEDDGGHLAAVWRRIREKAPDAPLELIHREAVLNLHAGVRYVDAYRAVFEHDLAAALRGVECEALVVCGADDPLVESARPAASALKRGALTLFPVGGTFLCDSHPALVAGALRGFLPAQGDP
jgi:pimeloyl-ACP methyl ester carboxylesterase